MNYTELASRFPALYQDAKTHLSPPFSVSNSNEKIPKILHYIWLGEKPLTKEFQANMSHFSAEMEALGGKTVLWTDQKNKLLSYPILHIDVDSYFGNPQSMRLFYHYRASLAKIPSNFGEAGDLLRSEIIDRFGGYYFDCDVEAHEVELKQLLKMGENPPHGFVCGYCSIGNYARNDLFGAIPNSLLMERYKDLVLSNYQNKVWNRHSTYSRSFLLDFTIMTTGPDAFEAVARAMIDPKNWEKTFLPSPKKYSAESWVYDHANPKPIFFAKNQEREDRIEHDLMLHLIYKPQILDLEKYISYLNDETLISLIEKLVQNHPSLFAFVDRIFIGSVDLYCRLKNFLGEERAWNEAAVLHFACAIKKEPLIRFLVEERHIDPTQAAFTDAGFYSCFC